MTESERLLELIERGVVEHGGDLGGWTIRNDDTLQLFDGRVTLRAEMTDPSSSRAGNTVHAHVTTTLHEYEDEVLDACLFGMGDNPEAALVEASMIWITGVAGPIKSFLDDKPVCMSSQAGVSDGDPSQGYSRGDFGLPGLRAYVGPSFSRGFDDGPIQSTLDDTKPWFRFAAESAAPRRVHLAKASIVSKGKEGWSRELEIDGHEVSHHDPDWPAGVLGPDFGYMTRFAVFEFSRNSTEMDRRSELDRTIRYFAENFSQHDSVDQLIKAMVSQGFDQDLIHEAESISTIAFSRVLFEQHGVQYSFNIIRARRSGQVETVPLMSIPSYCRARALAAELRGTMKESDFQSLCLYNAESNVILKAMEAAGDKLDLTQLKMYPCIVPDRGVSDQTMDIAFAKLNDLADRTQSPRTQSPRKKPWWNFW
jgi:hypothetical protein